MEKQEKAEMLFWAKRALAVCQCEEVNYNEEMKELDHRLNRVGGMLYKLRYRQVKNFPWFVNRLHRIQDDLLEERFALVGMVVYERGNLRIRLYNTRMAIRTFIHKLEKAKDGDLHKEGTVKAVRLPCGKVVKVKRGERKPEELPPIMQKVMGKPDCVCVYNAEAGEYVLTDGCSMIVTLVQKGLPMAGGAKVMEDKDSVSRYPFIIPGYRAGAMPSTDFMHAFDPVDTEEFSRMLYRARAAVKSDDVGRRSMALLYRMEGSRLGVVGISEDREHAFESCPLSGGKQVSVLDLDRLISMVEALARIGAAKVTIVVGEDQCMGIPVLIVGEGAYGIQAPMRYDLGYVSSRLPRRRSLPGS